MAYPNYKATKVTAITNNNPSSITPENKNNKGFMILPTFLSGASSAEIHLYSDPTGGEQGDSFTVYWNNDQSPISPVHIPFRVHSISGISSTIAYFIELQ